MRLWRRNDIKLTSLNRSSRLLSTAGMLALCAFMTLSQPAQAEGPPVRIGKHAAYTRVVFDWEKNVGWRADHQGKKIDIIFDSPEHIDLSPLKSAGPLIEDAKIIDDPALKGQAVHVQINVADGVTLRKSVIGPHVVLDIYKAGAELPSGLAVNQPPASTPEKTAAPAVPPAQVPAEAHEPPIALAPSVEKQPAEEKHAEEAQAPPAAPPQPLPEKEAQPVAAPPIFDKPELTMEERAIEAMRDEPETVAEPKPASETKKELPGPQTAGQEDTVVSVSSITPVNLAVFERARKLWVVVNAENAGTQPRVRGPFLDKLGPGQETKLPGATAYIYDMPKGLTVRVSGNNLKWDIALNDWPAPQPSELTGIPAQTDPDNGKVYLPVPFGKDSAVIKAQDPFAGDTLLIVPAQRAGQTISIAKELTDLQVLPAWQGLVVRPLRDSVEIVNTPLGKQVTAEGGLLASPDQGQSTLNIADAEDSYDDTPVNRIFDLANWNMGGIEKFEENRHALETELGGTQDKVDRTALFIKLAQLYFANGFGPEALGVLDLAVTEDPDLEKNLDFIALRGATMALAGRYEEALADLSIKELENEPEALLWRGYAASSVELWREAYEVFPQDLRLLSTYPDKLAIPVALYMAEAHLRAGDVKTAKRLLNALQKQKRNFAPNQTAALQYLMGEAYRQEGDYEQTMKQWEPLTKSNDRLYRAKASLALAALKLEQKKATPKEVTEELERLRYAWRGDAIEAQTMHRLGRLLIAQDRFIEGFSMLRDAASLKVRTANSKAIAEDMTRAFADLYVSGKADKLSPLEALAIYNEFSELTPVGPEGDKAIQNLAERLVQIDLLDRAAKLLEHQLEYRLSGKDAIAVGSRLAAIELLDNNPDAALKALDRSEYAGMDPATAADRKLLRARAWSQKGDAAQALSWLQGLNDERANNLRVDIYWQDKNWNAAAGILQTMLDAENAKAPPPPTEGQDPKTLTPRQSELVLNLAVAYKLGGQAEALAKLRDTYTDHFNKNGKGDIFRVVTRPPGRDTISDRDTMLELVSEVDMFGAFLDAYHAGGETAQSPAPATEPDKKNTGG